MLQEVDVCAEIAAPGVVGSQKGEGGRKVWPRPDKPAGVGGVESGSPPCRRSTDAGLVP